MERATPPGQFIALQAFNMHQILTSADTYNR